MLIFMQTIKYDNLTNSLLEPLIKGKKSFEILGAGGKIKECVNMVEKSIESNGLTCRVYTEGRIAGVASGVLVAGLGVATAVGIAAHNLFTFNPDYEIGKNLVKNKITVTFKKEPKK